MRLVALLLRRHRVALLAWTLSLLALVAATVPAYEATYPGLAARSVIVEQMRADQGSRVLYGELGADGTYGQLFAWETGTYVLLLVAVAAILLGIALTRGEEDAGRVELVRSVGVEPGAPVRAALLVLSGFCVVVGAGTAGILLAQHDPVELSATGAWGFAALTVVVGWTFGLIAVLSAQLRGDASGARSLAFLVLGMAFATRAIADAAASGRLGWLNWLSPLGWKGVLGPWDQDRVWTLVPMLMVPFALAGVVLVAVRRREVGGALLRGAGSSARRARVRSVEGWSALLSRGALVGWTVGVLGVAVLFGSMAQGLSGTLEQDASMRDLLQQMGVDLASPEQAYFSLLGSMVAVTALVGAVSLVLRWRAEEVSGRLVHELAVGTARWRSLLARSAVAAVAGVAWLALGGLAMGLLGRMLLEGADPMGAALRGTIGEAPGLVAVVGLVTLLCAVAPRVAVVGSWLLVGWSAFVLWFGQLVDLPEVLLEATALGHTGALSLGVLAALGAVTLAAGAAVVGRRDLRLG
ncbi:hypothetical protein ACQBAT_03940 [Ornithinimicrobium sp. Y1847]|uniref:hypothetical protein n=1 Tax=Ornithinimicrobium sp. Y1847 TaxID=3405419 RepID=UPI003B66D0CA